MLKATKKKTEEPLEKTLWKSADKLRKNMDAAEYKHIVLGLIFLKYISDAFEALHKKLTTGEGEYEGADAEDADEYRAENVFFVPANARWSYLQAKAKQPEIGKDVDQAMEDIEKENATLKGVLPKQYARQNLDKASLGTLIDMISGLGLGDAAAQAQDVLGRVYEYFLGEFAAAEGKKGGQFYTPGSIVKVLVNMLEPYKGRVYDPACGSGGMFVQAEKLVEAHQGRINDISIYGQESNQTTYRLCRMNLAIRGIDGSNVKWNGEGSFLNDAHKDMKAETIIANPPFNDSDWSGELLRDDPRWQYGLPPTGNANFAWMQHMIYHLAPTGTLGLVLANGSLSSNSGGEGDIRKAIVEAQLVDCIVALPDKLFYNTGIPACLWFISRDRKNHNFRNREDEILFIDARNLGEMITRRNRKFNPADIARIADTYHAWRKNSPSPNPLPEGEGLNSAKESSDNANPPLPEGEGRGEGDKYTTLPKALLENARLLRKKQTDAETFLWGLLRNRQLANAKFRRQHPLGHYILDFYCHDKKLAIELDGGQHNDNKVKQQDQIRTAWLEAQGITVLRFWNNEVLANPESVLESIYLVFGSFVSTPSPNPLPEGEGLKSTNSLLVEKKSSDKPNPPLPEGEGRGEGKTYEDIKGFCKSASLEEVRKHKHVLTPGRYVGIPDEKDDGIPFEEKMKKLTTELAEQMEQGKTLDARIRGNLAKVGFSL